MGWEGRGLTIGRGRSVDGRKEEEEEVTAAMICCRSAAPPPPLLTMTAQFMHARMHGTE